MWSTLAIAALLGSSCIAEGKTIVVSSSCSASAKSRATSRSKSTFVGLGVDLGGYVCHEQEPVTATLSATITDVARAVAKATVFVEAECSGTKGGSGHASAEGSALATAEAHATALFQGFASVETCGKCKAEVDLFLESTKSVFVEAVAEAWVEVSKGPKTSKTKRKKDMDRQIEKKIVPIFIEFLLQLHTAYGDCFAEIDAAVATGDNSAACIGIAESYTDEVSQSAIVKAGSEAAAYSCSEHPTQAQAYTVARATALAYARAVSYVYAACVTQGTGEGCVMSETSIKTVVKASAQAWAGAWATAANECGCHVNDDSVSEEIANIIVDAASDAYTDTCSSGYSDTFADAYAEAVAEASIELVATAFAQAHAGYDTCHAKAETEACVDCVERGQKCAGRGIEGVRGCCNPEDHCVQRSPKRSICRNKAKNIPDWWDGNIRTCAENSQ